MESKRCPYCNRLFEGFTKKQVEYYIAQHILSKHPEKIVFKEEKKS